MTRVGSRELKNRLGRYLARARRGETILVTDRGKPVARLAPARAEAAPAQSLEELLDKLEAEGMLQRGRLPFREHQPVKSKGKPASRIIIEERR